MVESVADQYESFEQQSSLRQSEKAVALKKFVHPDIHCFEEPLDKFTTPESKKDETVYSSKNYTLPGYSMLTESYMAQR